MAPTFKENLISVGQLTAEHKAKVVADNKEMVVMVGGGGGAGEIVAKKNGNMYIMEQVKTTNTNKNIQNTKESKNNMDYDGIYEISEKYSTADLLHQRLGHISGPKLQQVIQASTGIELDSKTNIGVCEGCHLGKSCRLKFAQHNNKLSSPMDMVVADLCGPIYGCYISGIIDVASGMVWVRIIKKKSYTSQHVMEWCTRAQTQTGKTLKRFHSDGGGEYLSNELKTFFMKQGTVMTTTTKGTPQHNGIMERMNRTILEIARSMLWHAHMHVSYWMDAVTTAVYLINRMVPSSLKSLNMTRYEAWTGVKPDLSHLRVFGCDVFRHIPKDE